MVLVIGRHMRPPDGSFGLGLEPFMRAWQRGGWVGVDLFFVLSGFLVSGLLFREYQQIGRVRIGRFLARRGLKIYPAFYALLLVGVLVEHLARQAWMNVAIPSIVSEAVFVQNYGPPVFGHTWSLAVEEHFYLLCALLLLFLARRQAGPDPFRAVPGVFAVVAVGCLAARVATAALLPPTYRTNLYPTHLRLDSLMFGVALAYVFHFRRDLVDASLGKRRGLAIAGGVVLLLPPFFFELERTPWLYTIGFTLFYLGSGLLVAAVTLGESPVPAWPVRVVAAIGAYSYSIYLWHVLVQQSLDLAQTAVGLEHWPLLGFLAYAVSSVLVGTAMAALIELPVLRIRDRLLPR